MGGLGEPNTAKPQTRSQVDVELSHIDEALLSLNDTTQKLEDRLNLVLTESSSGSDEAKDEHSVVQLAGTLRGFRKRILLTTESLSQILTRLEL